jgi:acyl-CoA reductase-like NAD-dependent aldehyde dehydrogenase
MDRFYTDENRALYRLLASSTDVDERRAILRLLADETARLKCELRKIGSEEVGRVASTRH